MDTLVYKKQSYDLNQLSTGFHTSMVIIPFVRRTRPARDLPRDAPRRVLGRHHPRVPHHRQGLGQHLQRGLLRPALQVPSREGRQRSVNFKGFVLNKIMFNGLGCFI